MSHPTWVRGLKLEPAQGYASSTDVAPYVGAWIETKTQTDSERARFGRTLRGCVD